MTDGFMAVVITQLVRVINEAVYILRLQLATPECWARLAYSPVRDLGGIYRVSF